MKRIIQGESQSIIFRAIDPDTGEPVNIFDREIAVQVWTRNNDKRDLEVTKLSDSEFSVFMPSETTSSLHTGALNILITMVKGEEVRTGKSVIGEIVSVNSQSDWGCDCIPIDSSEIVQPIDMGNVEMKFTMTMGNSIIITAILEEAQQAVRETKEATIRAAEATELATTAAGQIEEVKEAALSAAQSANEAAERASEETDKAVSATQAANEATQLAETATSEATGATSSALSAAEKADQAAEEAAEAAQSANMEAGRATEAAGKANSAAETANVAAQGIDDKINERISELAINYYGIQWDTTIANPVCTRIGNPLLHVLLPIQSKMRCCLLLDDGTVNYYLNHNNSKLKQNGSPALLDGTDGQVMVEIPAHYRKFEMNGTIRRAKISEYPLLDYHYVPKQYISAYEATFERSTGKLCSVVNMGVDYRGGNNQADWDGTYRSVLGRPATSKNRTAFRNAARLRGSTQWNCCLYNTYKDVAWLYYIEYANRNSQAPFNAQKDTNGFAQGGLGNGVTNADGAGWGNFNGNYPFVPCGHTDELGNASGEVAYNLPDEFTGAVRTVYANRYRGIENIFGHVWHWTDGVNIEIKTDADGGTSKVYVCNNPAAFSDSGYLDYEMRGLLPRANGYVKEILLGEYGDICPSVATGAGSTTYWCDYFYTSIANVLRGVLLGGGANSGAAAGLGCVRLYNAPSVADVYVGSRLCFLPG